MPYSFIHFNISYHYVLSSTRQDKSQPTAIQDARCVPSLLALVPVRMPSHVHAARLLTSFHTHALDGPLART